MLNGCLYGVKSALILHRSSWKKSISSSNCFFLMVFNLWFVYHFDYCVLELLPISPCMSCHQMCENLVVVCVSREAYIRMTHSKWQLEVYVLGLFGHAVCTN